MSGTHVTTLHVLLFHLILTNASSVFIYRWEKQNWEAKHLAQNNNTWKAAKGHVTREDEDMWPGKMKTAMPLKSMSLFWAKWLRMLLWGPLVCAFQGLIYSTAYSKALIGRWGSRNKLGVKNKGISLVSLRIFPHLRLPSSVVFTANVFPNWLFDL